MSLFRVLATGPARRVSLMYCLRKCRMTLPIRRLACAGVVSTLLVLSAGAARADVVLHWNDIAVRTLV